MANDIRQFNVQVDAFANKVGLAVTTVQKRVAFDLFGRIVRKTPVDTGRARASWNISVNRPNRATVGETHFVGAKGERVLVVDNNRQKREALRGGRLPNTLVVTRREAQAATKRTIADRSRSAIKDLQVAALQPGDEIWISNNLPYIVELEKGHSKKAPKGMVRLSIEEVNVKMSALMQEGLRDAGL